MRNVQPTSVTQVFLWIISKCIALPGEIMSWFQYLSRKFMFVFPTILQQQFTTTDHVISDGRYELRKHLFLSPFLRRLSSLIGSEDITWMYSKNSVLSRLPNKQSHSRPALKSAVDRAHIQGMFFHQTFSCGLFEKYIYSVWTVYHPCTFILMHKYIEGLQTLSFNYKM